MERNLIGKTIGPYTLLEKLGAGGTSTVYRARAASGEHELVAIKILPFHLAANEMFHQRFEREGEMTARLKHPHILPVYAFGEQDDAPYIVMKLVEGGTLADVINHGRVDLRLVARVVAQVASALDFAHSENVIHRDIKPENILFDAQGTAYLSDFGVARLYAGGDHITGTGGFVGTAAYASPEQCRGEDLTFTSDIYSLGIVLYEMLTGVLPFHGASPLATMHQHISEPVPNPLRDRSDLPIGIAEVIRKALAKLPQIRYQSATALSGGLNEALRPVLGTKPLAEKAPPMGPNPVFEAPPGGYNRVSPIPDKLLRDLAPTQPKPPVIVGHVPSPVPALPPAAAPEPWPSPARRGLTAAELVLLILTILAAAAVVAVVFMTR